MTSISVKQLEAFVQVADLRSFRGAADLLNTTQPNISARIAALEERLGCRLMERDAGSVRLTAAGSDLLDKARAALRSVEDVVLAAGRPALHAGKLRLGATEAVVHSWLGRFLSAFGDRFAGIEIELVVDFSANLSVALHENAIDLALQSGPFDTPASGMLDLGRCPLIWAAAPRLGLGGRPLTVGEIAGHRVLTHAKHTLPYRQLAQHLREQRPNRIRLVPSTNASACLKMAQEGLGIACLPNVILADDLRAGRLEQLRYLWTPDDLHFAARFSDERAPRFVRQAAEIAAATTTFARR